MRWSNSAVLIIEIDLQLLDSERKNNKLNDTKGKLILLWIFVFKNRKLLMNWFLK